MISVRVTIRAAFSVRVIIMVVIRVRVTIRLLGLFDHLQHSKILYVQTLHY